MKEHWSLLPGQVKVLKHWSFDDHTYLETLAKSGLGLVEVESERCVDDPEHIISIVEFCKKQHGELCAFSGTCKPTTKNKYKNRLKLK